LFLKFQVNTATMLCWRFACYFVVDILLLSMWDVAFPPQQAILTRAAAVQEKAMTRLFAT
jgi:hypothetical protein